MERKMKRWKGLIKGIIAFALALVMAMSPIPGTDFVLSAYAGSNKTITGLCTGAIGNPNTIRTNGWTGSYVYYGCYDNNPMKYRVLDTAATEFNANSMLLDYNSGFETIRRFDDDSNEWANSEIKVWLNGSDFYNNTAVFSAMEKNAIVNSTKSSVNDAQGESCNSGLSYAPLAGEHIFFLDSAEATRSSYGYSSNANRIKKDSDEYIINWWLRSFKYLYTNDRAGYVSNSGGVRH